MGTHGRRRHSRRQPPPVLLPPSTSTGATSTADLHRLYFRRRTRDSRPRRPIHGGSVPLDANRGSLLPTSDFSVIRRSSAAEPAPTSTTHDSRFSPAASSFINPTSATHDRRTKSAASSFISLPTRDCSWVSAVGEESPRRS
ncbi:papain family cysteine protease [Striga asiatica]|uniref:Papain family cysteine protease n=1 Tax=Striga asiatica TaxID=4170 RepID=A0A5A7Q8W0_STRAF|nr:papain family cysteine protease [Striga asiatica]